MTVRERDVSSGSGEMSSRHHRAAADRPDETVHSLRVLERLAQVLGVPMESFFETTEATAPKQSLARQAAELSRIFLAIDDPDQRRRCLDFVRAVAETRERGRRSVS